MASKKEVLRYEADTTEAEAKIKSLAETESQTMGDATRAAEGTTAATEDLLKQKEKLGAVVRSLGGNFSGLVGDLGGVLDLLLSANTAALGAGGALAALGVGAAIFSKLKEGAKEYADQLDRVRRVQQALHEESLTLQQKVAEVLHQAGVAGAAEPVRLEASRLIGRGFDEQLAIFAAAAEQIGGLDEAQRRAVMAGYLVGKREAQLTGTQAEMRAMIDQLVARGNEPGAQEFLRGYERDLGRIVGAGTARPGEPPVDVRRYQEQYELALRRLARLQGLNERDLEVLRRLRDEDIRPETVIPAERVRRLFPENVGFGDEALQSWWMGGLYGAVREEMAEGGTRRIHELRTLARQAQVRAGATVEFDAPRDEPPVIYNVGTIIGPAGNPLMSPHPRARPGETLTMRGPE